MAEKLTTGRIVHTRLPGGRCSPVMVVRVWSDTCFNGIIFCDGSNDDGEGIPNRTPGALISWITSTVLEQEAGTGVSFYSWHWPERDS